MEILEGVGNEVIYFGLASLICSVLLYKVLQNLFNHLSSDTPSSSEMTDTMTQGRTRTSDQDCCICLGQTEFALGMCILELSVPLFTSWVLEFDIG